jgi:hypothetical protein
MEYIMHSSDVQRQESRREIFLWHVCLVNTRILTGVQVTPWAKMLRVALAGGQFTTIREKAIALLLEMLQLGVTLLLANRLHLPWLIPAST